MRSRWLLAAAMLGAFGLPLQLGAQGGSIGVRTGQPAGARPAPRPSPPPGPRRPGTIVTVPQFQRVREHRPIYFRSSFLGLVAFDPYWWLAPDFGDESLPPPETMPPPSPHLMGGLQLDVEPRRALVYLDGILIGTVDQFKGYFHHLETTAGYHVVEFITPDYEPLMTGVTVVPNMTTTYRAFLNRASGR
jgi:hypothetical protein